MFYLYSLSLLISLIEKYSLLSESYVLEDLYYNIYSSISCNTDYNIHCNQSPILVDDVRLFILDNMNVAKHELTATGFDEALISPSIKFISNSESGWSKEMEKYLCKNFLPMGPLSF